MRLAGRPNQFSMARGAAGLALALGVATGAAAARQGDDYDPFEGIDRDGRIPAALKPPELEHPERWRYIPEGRMKPGHLFQRFLVSSFIAPFFFRSEDVGIVGGVAITDIDFRQQRRREFAGIFLTYSEEGQQSYAMVWRRWMHHIDLPDGGVLQEERSFYRGHAEYSKTLTRRFYGLGSGSDEDDETSYTDEVLLASFGVQRSFPDPGDDLILGFGLLGENHGLSDGEVGGKPNTGDVFPVLFDDADGESLGWLRADVAWDTRDSQRNPYRGWRLGARAEAALFQSNGDVGARYTLSGSKIHPLPGLFHTGGDPEEANPPTDTLALGLRAQLSSGDLPFFALPSLGGASSLRGYIDGRFRDDASWLGSVEYRFWLLPRGVPIPFTRALRIERVGAALFYELGSVGSDGANLFSASVKHSYGVGLLFTLERAAPFRVDVGFSDEDVIVSARFGLSF